MQEQKSGMERGIFDASLLAVTTRHKSAACGTVLRYAMYLQSLLEFNMADLKAAVNYMYDLSFTAEAKTCMLMIIIARKAKIHESSTKQDQPMSLMTQSNRNVTFRTLLFHLSLPSFSFGPA